MAWIRLSDDYVDDEKFQALSDGAFRLWHEGLAYCRRHQTDGIIPFTVMRGLRSFTKGREKQLACPVRDGKAALWLLVPAVGYAVHNYLTWNPSKDEENERRAESKLRMRTLREQRQVKGVAPPPGLPSVCANSARTHANVLEREKDPENQKRSVSDARATLEQRAGRLREELYPGWYAKYRHGARLRIPLIVNSLEFQEALSLVQTWDDARLEQLARIVLTTNDEFIAGTDRGFKIFALKASWAENRLCEIEQGAASA